MRQGAPGPNTAPPNSENDAPGVRGKRRSRSFLDVDAIRAPGGWIISVTAIALRRQIVAPTWRLTGPAPAAKPTSQPGKSLDRVASCVHRGEAAMETRIEARISTPRVAGSGPA